MSNHPNRTAFAVWGTSGRHARQHGNRGGH